MPDTIDVRYLISIHALVKRATVSAKFNAKRNVISIHALVKRATYPYCFLRVSDYHFNPRPRKEGDEQRRSDACRYRYFNPRPRKEGDFRTPLNYIPIGKFQSTPS